MIRIDRHRLFYRLIDVAFAIQLLVIGTELVGAAGLLEVEFGRYIWFGAVIAAFGLIIPALLIFLRSMRDEFTEMLWQKTAGTVLKALIILPIPVMIAVGLATLDPPGSGMMRVDADRVAFEGMLNAAVYLWMVTPVVFTFAFQWHRWRSST